MLLSWQYERFTMSALSATRSAMPLLSSGAQPPRRRQDSKFRVRSVSAVSFARPFPRCSTLLPFFPNVISCEQYAKFKVSMVSEVRRPRLTPTSPRLESCIQCSTLSVSRVSSFRLLMAFPILSTLLSFSLLRPPRVSDLKAEQPGKCSASMSIPACSKLERSRFRTACICNRKRTRGLRQLSLTALSQASHRSNFSSLLAHSSAARTSEMRMCQSCTCSLPRKGGPKRRR
mmetsp:Transcript_27791/g.58784  ORF Transcript_27791/g.58784 Transcript_27791/m.58784 type:complete len:231 (-) Transcript_27791:1746-2438(-)